MSIERQYPSNQSPTPSLLRTVLSVLGTLFVIGLLFIILALAVSPVGSNLTQAMNWLFAANSIQLWWYVTRAAGIIAYLLLWFSTVWGLAIPSKFFDKFLDRSFTFDFHQFISLLSIGFILLHILVLTFDRYLPYSIWQVLIPFLSPYRPLWVGIGVIAFYITLLVTVTFYIRSRIGLRTFRVIHYLSLVSYLGVTLHGLYAGTDSPLPAMKLLYAGTGLIVVFLTVYWLVFGTLRKREAQNKALPASPTPHSQRASLR